MGGRNTLGAASGSGEVDMRSDGGSRVKIITGG
jgi:hypothetical protein